MTQTPDASTLASWEAGDPALMLASAEAEVRSYCGWHIYPVNTDDVVTVNGSGRATQPLPTLYLTAVTAVTETTLDSGVETTTTLTEGVDFDWSQAGYLTRISDYPCAWTSKLRGVTATITHGYDECPPEVQAVILSLASRGGVADGVDMAGPFRYTPPKNSDGTTGGMVLSALEKAVLDRYRIPAKS